MMQINVLSKSIDTLSIQLVGTLDENDQFSRWLPEVPKNLHIVCDRLIRINSVGVREWVRFFERLRQQGVALRFSGCSPAMVDMMNMISNFCRDGEVESIQIPFFCTPCRKEWMACVQIKGLLQTKGIVSSPKCRDCQGQTQFDDFAAEYFGFLKLVRTAPLSQEVETKLPLAA